MSDEQKDPPAKPGDHAKDLPPGASPRSGLPPPPEHRWKPGVSGNQSGRPKGASPSDAMRRFAGKTKKQLARINHETLTIIELGVVQLLIESATKSTLKNMEFFAERLDGKVAQTTLDISLKPEELDKMTDEQIDALLGRVK